MKLVYTFTSREVYSDGDLFTFNLLVRPSQPRHTEEDLHFEFQGIAFLNLLFHHQDSDVTLIYI